MFACRSVGANPHLPYPLKRPEEFDTLIFFDKNLFVGQFLIF